MNGGVEIHVKELRVTRAAAADPGAVVRIFLYFYVPAVDSSDHYMEGKKNCEAMLRFGVNFSFPV